MHNIIIAGCGGMSDAWIDFAVKRSGCRIVGLADIRLSAAEAKKDKFNLSANTYSSIEEALAKEDADLVFDITIPEAHFHTVTSALRAGCHVFGEKPMSDSLADAERMVECAEATGNEYFVMQNRRYLRMSSALKHFLESRRLGEIGQVSANFQLGFHFGGFREEMDSPLIADMAIHTFDTARFLTGKNAISVYCHEFNPPWSWFKGNAGAVCIFEMEDGSVFDYRGSWCANGLNTPWESEWRISCADGTVFWDGSDKLFFGTTGGEICDIPSPPATPEGHEACIKEMFDALECSARPQTDCRDNINSIRMVHKAIESAKLRKALALC